MKNIVFKIAMNCLPNCFWPLKVKMYKKMLKKYGKNVRIGKRTDLIHPENISIGNDVFIAQNFYASTIKNLIIGDRVMFGPKCAIIGGDHDFSNPFQNMRYTHEKGDNRDIVIEDDAWIGYGTLILKKAMIGEGSIVGAMSVVNQILEPYCVYVGNPAKKIRPRFASYEELLSYLEMMKNKYNFMTKYTQEELKKIYEK